MTEFTPTSSLPFWILAAWFPVTLIIFAVQPPRRAVLISMIGGWLFLPMVSYRMSGLPDFSKMIVTSLSVLVAMILLDSGRLSAFRPRIYDLPIALWCVVPFFASISNNLGVYDGLSALKSQFLFYGLPYFIGRIYFSDLEGLRELAVGVMVGCLIYVPLCWFEIRFSPQLHKYVYGFHRMGLQQARRFGGYRPAVFMQHGLALALWMTAGTMIAAWLWRTGAMRRMWGMPMGAVTLILLTTTIFVKSTGAWLLLAVGMTTLYLSWIGWGRGALLTLMFIPTIYMTARFTDLYSGITLVEAAGTLDEDRARSIYSRIRSEELMTQRAFERPIFGWGGWGRSMVVTETERSLNDALYMMAMGQNGLVGLTGLTALFLLPQWLFLKRFPTFSWTRAALAPPAALVVFTGLYMVDNLFNAMVNPVLWAVVGATTGLAVSVPKWMSLDALAPPSAAPPRPPARAVMQTPSRRTPIYNGVPRNEGRAS